jgi:hypothetical protein
MLNAANHLPIAVILVDPTTFTGNLAESVYVTVVFEP